MIISHRTRCLLRCGLLGRLGLRPKPHQGGWSPLGSPIHIIMSFLFYLIQGGCAPLKNPHDWGFAPNPTKGRSPLESHPPGAIASSFFLINNIIGGFAPKPPNQLINWCSRGLRPLKDPPIILEDFSWQHHPINISFLTGASPQRRCWSITIPTPSFNAIHYSSHPISAPSLFHLHIAIPCPPTLTLSIKHQHPPISYKYHFLMVASPPMILVWNRRIISILGEKASLSPAQSFFYRSCFS